MAPAGPEAPPDRAGIAAALGCYTLWGFMPLLFMALAQQGFTSLEILAHRALWSVIWAAGLVWLARQGGQAIRALATPRTLGWLMLSTLLIVVNWGLYVWATTHGATLEASLGYYINPLLNVAAGALLFRERIDRAAGVAIGLAVVGVGLQTVALGRLPWIALTLAFSFAAYGVIRKRVPVDAQAGLLIECLLMVVPGGLYLAWLQSQGAGSGFSDPAHLVWALATGPATVLPLALFAWSARRLPLSLLGFIQFLAPTLQFAIGVLAGEPFTALRALSFVFIWTGAGVFAWAAWRRGRLARLAVRGQSAA